MWVDNRRRDDLCMIRMKMEANKYSPRLFFLTWLCLLLLILNLSIWFDKHYTQYNINTTYVHRLMPEFLFTNYNLCEKKKNFWIFLFQTNGKSTLDWLIDRSILWSLYHTFVLVLSVLINRSLPLTQCLLLLTNLGENVNSSRTSL